MTGQYVFSATPPAENPEVDRRFHEYTRTGTVRSWDDYLEAEKACRHEAFYCHGCRDYHEQLVMGLV